MDLRKLVADGEATMEVKDTLGDICLQDDGKTPISITFAGIDSPEWIRAVARNADERNDQIRRSASPAPRKFAAIDDEAIGLLASVTKSWAGIMLDGKALDCSFDNAKKVYTAVPIVREQANGFIGNRANFVKASSKI